MSNNSNSDTILISDALRETQAATIAAADINTSSSSLNHHPNRSISGTAVEEEDDSATAENQLSADLALFLANPSLRAALADGSLDLKSYSVTVNEEVQQLEKQCIAVYRSKEQEIAELAKDAEVCQTVLRQLHEMLLGFQADLGGLSGDIRQLQEKSRTLDVQLRNRRAAEAALRHFLEHLIVSPETANAILTGPVNTTFVAAVAEVQQLYKDCSSEKPQEWSAEIPVTETVAGQEMKQHLHTLRLVAVQRSREYLLQQMALLRRPQTNVRLLQVHGLLKHAALYDFLEDCSPDTIATEIFHVYCESMTVTLQQLFRTYSQQLLQLDATHTHCGRADVIAMDEAVFKDRPSARLKKRVDLFCLGSRASDCFPGSSSGGGGGGGGEPPQQRQPAPSAHSGARGPAAEGNLPVRTPLLQSAGTLGGCGHQRARLLPTVLQERRLSAVVYRYAQFVNGAARDLPLYLLRCPLPVAHDQSDALVPPHRETTQDSVARSLF